ncbi:MAG: sigma 54-interacting transcriptional regulator, partial [Acidobacteria bacterium]|nr:sigma 54-interacting transcriptional regulator [Acidobacteriota bacterium]
ALVDRCGGGLDTVGPESTCAGIEAAARVRCGGTDVGGLAVRWPADAVLHAERVRWLLSAAASALAPALRVLADDHRVAAPAPGPIGELSGGSVVMGELRQHVARAAAAPYPVLVQGESGTGKELIARAVHAASPRKGRRFCAVNCAALSDDLFESELFGHTRGAFTGATSDRVGLFEEADAGTLFLDEVSELSARVQAKLLRVIQEGEIRRIGENHPRRVDARIVAATNRALHEDVRAGRFRHDLLFRLDVVRIEVPPLRDRPEDVPELVHRFWKEAMGRTGGHAILAPATVATLARYDWPGNVRELQNVLAALAVQAPRHGRVGPALLPGVIARAAPDGSPACTTLVMARRRFEERFVRATLARTGGRRSQTAAALGVSRQGLSKLMARLGIDETRPPDPCVS